MGTNKLTFAATLEVINMRAATVMRIFATILAFNSCFAMRAMDTQSMRDIKSKMHEDCQPTWVYMGVQYNKCISHSCNTFFHFCSQHNAWCSLDANYVPGKSDWKYCEYTR